VNIIWKGSPNYDDQTFRKPVRYLVLHWFGIGTLDSADARFQNPVARASAHYGISNDTIYQWVKDDCVSWGCGNYPMNQQCINIEHDATTTQNASEATYQTSAILIEDICTRYNIPLSRDFIKGHREISPTQCPGTLDLDYIIALALKIRKEREMNDQTLIPLGGEWGDMELQKVRSELNDQKARIKSQVGQIETLTAQLGTTPPEVVVEKPSVIEAALRTLILWIKNLVK